MTDSAHRRLRVLVLDDDLELRRSLAICMESLGHIVATVPNVREALRELAKAAFDVIFLELRVAGENTLDYLTNMLSLGQDLTAIVLTDSPTFATAVEAMKLGTAEYLAKPFGAPQIGQLMNRLAEQSAAKQKLRALEVVPVDGALPVNLATSSAELKHTWSLARSAAATVLPVLIYGETGVGKKVLARCIHAWSARAEKPFVLAKCKGESPNRIELELFGRPETGGGCVKVARGGTLVIDELADLSPAAQARLAQLIQTESDAAPAVRVIALTESDPAFAVTADTLTEALYYAFNAFRLPIPPLRARPEDVQLLAERFLAQVAGQQRNSITGFAADAIDTLRSHAWPGNIRELRGVIEHAIATAKSDRIAAADLSIDPTLQRRYVSLGDAVPLETVEEIHIRRVLESTNSFDEASTILNIDPATLWRKRKKYGC